MDENLLQDRIRKIQQIDRILEDPVNSLIAIAIWNLRHENHPLEGVSRVPMYFPAWVSDRRQAQPPKQEDPRINLTTALCCKTLQRVWRQKRRYPSLQKRMDNLEKEIVKKSGKDDDRYAVEEFLAQALLPPEGSTDYARFLRSGNLMDEWFPFSTSHAFWVLLHGGEGTAYTPVGVISLFAMLWALGQTTEKGASIGLLGPPSAYVTNSCLSSIEALCRTCDRRARLLGGITIQIEEIDSLVRNRPERARRDLPFRLDRLLGLLYDYSSIATNRRRWRECAWAIEKQVETLTLASPAGETWRVAIAPIAQAIRETASMGIDLVREMRATTTGVLRRIVEAFDVGDGQPADLCALEERVAGLRDVLGDDLPIPYFPTEHHKREHWRAVSEAAAQALGTCETAIEEFDESVRNGTQVRDVEEILHILRGLEAANREVARSIKTAVAPAQEWCNSTMRRELANASTNNLTEFDPAELVSALEVAVSAEFVTSTPEVRSGAAKAAEALRKDGSWIAGQPWYLDSKLSSAAYAPTADIVWTLVRTLRKFPDVTVVDPAIDQFVDWLDINRRRFTIGHIGRDPVDGQELIVHGWVSERQIRPERIDLWATAFAINALIEIRGLLEGRLWSMCEERFTIVSNPRPPHEIAPVDLDATHSQRLHRTLARMARSTRSRQYESAVHSIVLHGPPGSSKTAIAGAVSRLMWQDTTRRFAKGTRLIRITPADFTRLGEDKVDFEARLIFDLLTHIRGATLLFDEIDDLLRKRRPTEPVNFLRLVVPAMLNRLQDLRDACPGQALSFIIATNYIDNVEPALIRRGRIDQTIPLVYPDRESRRHIIETQLDEVRDQGLRAELSAALLTPAAIADSDFWPFKTLESACREMIRHAADEKLDVDIVKTVMEAHKASVEWPYEEERLRNLMVSPPFRDEVLVFLMAGASSRGEYLSVVGKRLGIVLQTEALDEILTRAGKLWSERHSRSGIT